jgi:flagellar biosynthesis/type III secretory pathway protein FliH
MKSEEIALEIMALVDENPSEPFSYERKRVLEQITDICAQAWNEMEDEATQNYELGREDGFRDGYDEAEQESDNTIQDLEERIKELEEDVRKAYDDGLAVGTEMDRS